MNNLNPTTINILALVVWVLSQAFFFFFIICHIRQQIGFLLGYRKWVPMEDRNEDEFHKWGGIKSVAVAVVICALQIFLSGWWFALMGPITFGMYIRYYDRLLNKGLCNPAGYLGDKASWDVWWKNHFGPEAGLKKEKIGLYIFLLFNLAYILITIFTW